jgi:hypothetical protein
MSTCGRDGGGGGGKDFLLAVLLRSAGTEIK